MPKNVVRLFLLLVLTTGAAVGCGHAAPNPHELAAQTRRQELLEARLRRLETRIRHMDHVLSLVEARPRAARITQARAKKATPRSSAADNAEQMDPER